MINDIPENNILYNILLLSTNVFIVLLNDFIFICFKTFNELIELMNCLLCCAMMVERLGTSWYALSPVYNTVETTYKGEREREGKRERERMRERERESWKIK